MRDARDRPLARPCHRLRGSRLSQHRRMLGKEARHLHDHGRDLHPRLRLLQRRDRRASALDPNEPESVAKAVERMGPHPRRHHFRRSRRSRRRRRPAFCRCHPRHSRALPSTTIEILTPDFLRKEGALEIVVAARPDVFNHNLEDDPVQLSHGASRRPLLPLHPPASAREGARPLDLHQVRHHGRSWRRAERGAAAHGRPALGRTSTS